jgi:hypothetical protein
MRCNILFKITILVYVYKILSSAAFDVLYLCRFEQVWVYVLSQESFHPEGQYESFLFMKINFSGSENSDENNKI